MATCGSCKQEGQTVEHIKQCYADKRASVSTVELTGPAKQYVESRDYRPMALWVPDSKYALVRPSDGLLEFFEVKTGKGKWAGKQFVERLIGAPGDWRRYPVRGMERQRVMQQIDFDPKAAAIRFSKEFTVCAVCGSPLSDPESLALGLGPICARRF